MKKLRIIWFARQNDASKEHLGFFASHSGSALNPNVKSSHGCLSGSDLAVAAREDNGMNQAIVLGFSWKVLEHLFYFLVRLSSALLGLSGNSVCSNPLPNQCSALRVKQVYCYMPLIVRGCIVTPQPVCFTVRPN